MNLYCQYLYKGLSCIKYYNLTLCEVIEDYPEDHDLSIFLEMSSFSGVEVILWI